MLRSILKYPDPLLKQKSAPVDRVDSTIRQLIEDMFETMYAAPGVGLAAPQVGILKRILVVDVGRIEGDTQKPDPKAIINPVITLREKKIIWEEGCLSLPQLIIPVERSRKIIVEGLDQDGKTVKFSGEDLLAVAFQHEMDHLEGILLSDRISRLKRELYLKKLANLTPPLSEKEIPRGTGPAYMG